MKLRDYQVALIKKATAKIGQFVSPIVQLPTGGGKTVIAAAVVKSVVNETFPAWFVCHRKEILDQAVDTLISHGINTGVVASGREYDPNPLVHACSIGSLPSRMNELRHPRLIVWDECHHMASPSWAAMHEAFPEAVHLGLTATPERLDGIGLSEWFNDLIVGPPARDLIDQGYLSSFRVFAPSVPDLRGVRSVNGDYRRTDVSKAMDRPTLVGDMVEHYQRITPGQRALVFAASVEASKNVVERFLVAGVPAAHIDAKTAPDQRSAIITRFAEGKISVLSNVELFTEGFDCPAVDVVILLRPTKSRALYLQMVGRGMRTHPGKAATIILDHAGLIYAHGMPDDAVDWSLDGRQLREEKPLGARLRRCPECFAIHEWGVECVECGYVYTEADRSVDEVYGELVELKLALGTERMTDFMKRVGVSSGNLFQWFKRGLPRNSDGSVTIETGLKWIADNASTYIRHFPPKPDKDNVTIRKFAEMNGVNTTTIYGRIKKGLPVSKDGLINIQEANKWLDKDLPFRKTLSWKKVPLGYESITEFAKRIGISTMTVSRMIKLGLPTNSDGYIRSEGSVKWVLDNPLRFSKSDMFDSIDGCERPVVFARRVGITSGRLHDLVKRAGMPVEKNGYINVVRGEAWLSNYRKTHPSSGKRPIHWTKIPFGHESIASFARRIGVGATTAHRMTKLGLPTENGYINVARGEAWVSDYRKTRSAAALAARRHELTACPT